jgi:hypothetical protein
MVPPISDVIVSLEPHIQHRGETALFQEHSQVQAMAGSVCAFCQCLFPGANLGPFGRKQILDIKHHPSFLAFVNSSKDCSVCKLILEHLIIKKGQGYVNKLVAGCPWRCTIKYHLKAHPKHDSESPLSPYRISMRISTDRPLGNTEEGVCNTHMALQTISILSMVTQNGKSNHLIIYSCSTVMK